MILIAIEKITKKFALLMINFYRGSLSQFFGGNCRFFPSCSQYAVDCFKEHPPLKATKLTLVRICKCRPGGPYGWDPAPRGKTNE